ncbi:MAG TPA: hypothetical protein VJ842_10770 [Pyrinomonadaceae bacterium]|nr:hypothetical protein [Pyrinomonadaceae bacterium]
MPRNKKVKKALKNQAEDQVSEQSPENTSTELQVEEKGGAFDQPLPAEVHERFQLPPDQFVESQNQLEELTAKQRERMVYADSIESAVGYNSLIRLLGHHFIKQVAYYRSKEGGSLSLDEARANAYRQCKDEEQAKELFDLLMSIPIDWIDFKDLLELNSFSTVMAENVWEVIKREAKDEFESGHLAANAFEPVDYLKDAWTRARYLGLRESFATEWQPRGGIELSMIDAMAQAFLQLQYWTEQTVKRSRTEPREEAYEYQRWKHYQREAKTESWKQGHWDIPYVREQDAVQHAASMADRWQRMYFRAVRQLRDWRRYSPQVTINNPQQVNIGEQVNVASDGGQQVNVKADK